MNVAVILSRVTSNAAQPANEPANHTTTALASVSSPQVFGSGTNTETIFALQSGSWDNHQLTGHKACPPSFFDQSPPVINVIALIDKHTMATRPTGVKSVNDDLSSAREQTKTI